MRTIVAILAILIKKSKGILMDAIVAIMAVLKILLIPNDRNCCNYGNFGKKVVNPSDHNCCNYGNSEKRNYMNLIDRNCCNYANFENYIVDS